MKVLLIAWEYPPRSVGSSSMIGEVAEKLAENHEVVVVAYDTYTSLEEGNPEVHRVPFHVNSDSFFNWALLMNTDLKGLCASLVEEKGIDVVHAFDWPTFPTAIALKKLYGLPLAVTMTATEHQRSGLKEKHANLICDMEWWGSYEADFVFASEESFGELQRNYGPPEEKLRVFRDAEEVKRAYEVIENESTAIDMGVPAA